MLQRVSRLLFGYDIFISYPYADGKRYAEALKRQLAGLDFACFLDKQELAYGQALTSSLRAAIRRSRALVLVGTFGALRAPYVNLEVRFALANRKVVLPIDINGIRGQTPWPNMTELPWLEEA